MIPKEFSRDGCYSIKGFLIPFGITKMIIQKDDSETGNIKKCTFKLLDYISKNKNTVFESTHKKHFKFFSEFIKKFAIRKNVNYLFNENKKTIYLCSNFDISISDYIFKLENKKTETQSIMLSNLNTNTRITPTGTISMNDVRTELKLTGQLDLNNSAVRTLAGKTSGQISLSDLRGKSSQIQYSMKIGSLAGDNNLGFNMFGYYKDSTTPADNFGTLSTINLDGNSAKIASLIVSVVKDDWTNVALDITKNGSTHEAGVKYTNNVEMTIFGKKYNFNWYPSSSWYTMSESKYKEFGVDMRNNFNKNVVFTLRWYN